LYNKTTGDQKNAKPTKTSTNQTNQRLTRPNSVAIPKNPAHARLPNNNQDKKKLWSILWSKHHLPLTKLDGKEGLPNKCVNMNTERPRKIYTITNEGQNMLNFTENSLRMMFRQLNSENNETDYMEIKIVNH
jgi:hypothetical protein